TAKAGTVLHGAPETVTEYEVAGRTHSGQHVRGSGYPVRFPFLDLAEVSAGGGTIAHVDAGGALRVGPMSAGADPGPVCYGRRGASPWWPLGEEDHCTPARLPPAWACRA